MAEVTTPAYTGRKAGFVQPVPRLDLAADLARDLFRDLVTQPGCKSLDPGHLAHEAHRLADIFAAVADERRRGSAAKD